ncbi:MAG: J domain-containing protein [Microcystaceae cyanobacterium]
MLSEPTRFLNSHYSVLGLHPGASAGEIRQTYRELSKRYHPDTTLLPPDLATLKFQRLKIAYEVLSDPERRSLYDGQMGYGNWVEIANKNQPTNSSPEQQKWSHTAYLDSEDRPLSAGEVFALCLLGLTLLGCLGLAFLIAWLRNDSLF